MRNFIMIVFLLTAFGVFAQEKQMTLEDAIMGRYTYLRPESMNGLKWKNDKIFTFLENDTLWAGEAKNGKLLPLINLIDLNSMLNKSGNSELKQFPGYSWTKNGMLLFRNSRKFTVVNPGEKQIAFQIELPEKAENAEFCETGKFVAFTVDDDLFVTFADGKTLQITEDGGNGIVNGKTVHRNEFGISDGIFISPKGKSIAFYRKDETMVTDYPVVDFMERSAEYTPVKYPMAGMNSHHVTVGIYSLETGKTKFLNTGGDPEHFLTNIAWSPDGTKIFMAELNRGQDHMQLNCYDISTGNKEKTLFEETSETYVEPLYPIRFSEVNENEFYYLGRKDGWFHIYKYNADGKLLQQITKGEWEVTRILGFDEKEKNVFVEATKESPLERHIYRVEVKSGETEKLTEGAGIHNGILSSGGSYFIDRFSAPEIPSQISLISGKGKKLKTLFTAGDPLQNYKLGENKLVPIQSADGKTELAGRLILPPGFNPSKKYPVIVYVYGGPHSQMVTKDWHNSARWWQYYMASQGYIAFTMDNRGTNNRGRAFETAVHRRLGVLETEDQMQGIEYLKSLPYVDADRIGVHGWSYGGFMTLNLMMRHPEIFKVGVAGGPVVDWSMYEVMYGERYMDRPNENPEGYAESNMLNHVADLNGKLLIIHGVQDDVVVMQHSMKFLRECVKQNKQPDFFVYPTHPHNVRGKDRVHLMRKVSDYFIDNL
ncbi:MAG: S9 family peptidase [Tangfeifania sp.]